MFNLFKKRGIAVIALLMSMLSVNAHDFESGGIYYNILSEEERTVEVTFQGESYNEYEGEYLGNVVIPSSVNGYTVQYIGNTAFCDCSGLTSVTIPGSVKTIGEYAFTRCSVLTSVTISDGVEAIGRDAFSSCTSLTSITIPGSVKTIGKSPFYLCKSLTSVTLSEGVETIGEYAFSCCFSLTSITIPSSVKSIGDLPFLDTNLTTVNLNCKTVGQWFSSASSTLKEVILGDNVETIGSYAFGNCSGLTSITIPESVTTIGSNAFDDCTGLTSITIPENVTTIGEWAFSGCSGLTSIIFSDAVETIGEYAFADCSGLTSIAIPESVTSIGEKAFVGCTSLTTLNLNCKTVRQWFSDISSTIKEVNLGDNVEAIYGAFSRFSGLTSITIPESVTTIGSSAFYGCTGLTSITIPESVTTIGSNAFYGCTGLTSITIPESVTIIDYDVFKYCTGLTSITIPESVTSIGDRAFDGCSGLTSITIPESVTSIGSNAFRSCTSLTTLNLNCKTIGNWFSDSSSTIKEVILGDEVTSIENSAFSGFTGLTSIIIPQSVTSVGSNVFRGCVNLSTLKLNGIVDGNWFSNIKSKVKEVIIGEGVTSINEYALEDFINLSTLELPSTLESVGSGAFSGCENLTTLKLNCDTVKNWFSDVSSTIKEVILGESVKRIGVRAFSGCSDLTLVIIPDGVETIGYQAFKDCPSLTSITIPNSVRTIEEGAFSGCSITTLNLNCETVKDWFSDIRSTVKEVILGNGVVNIGSSAFDGFSGIVSINIPNSVKQIGSCGFCDCNKLKKVHYLGSEEQWENVTVNKAGNAPLLYCHCCEEVTEECLGDVATGWGCPKCREYIVNKAELDALHNHVDGYCTKCEGINRHAVELVITDGKHTTFEVPRDMALDQLTYKRTLPNTEWNALYVPFEVEVTEELQQDYEVAYINDVRSYDKDDNGEVDQMVMEVIKIKNGTLNANYPYLIRAKHNDAKALNWEMTDATLYAFAENMLTCSSVFMQFDVYSTYSQKTAAELDGCYAISTTGAWQPLAAGTRLNPFRLYMQMTELPGSPVKVSPLALSKIYINVQGEGETTEITYVEDSINKQDVIHDLSGRRVMNPVKGGLYIVNGKKVIY